MFKDLIDMPESNTWYHETKLNIYFKYYLETEYNGYYNFILIEPIEGKTPKIHKNRTNTYLLKKTKSDYYIVKVENQEALNILYE